MLNRLMSATAALALTLSLAPAQAQTMDWDAVVAAAQEEGEVTWFVWYFEDRFREFTKAFTEEYGIEVRIPDGDHIANIDKMIAEAGRETGDIDVLAYGFDQLPNINPELFIALDGLPADEGRVATVAGIEGGAVAVAYWGNQTGIAYDPAKIADEDLPQTPEDFAAFWTSNPGQFGFNYENGGSGPSFYMSVLRAVSDVDFSESDDSAERIAALQGGIDFFNEHADDYVITASNADSITRLSDGEFTMVAAWEDHLAGLQVNGEVRDEIRFYIPEMGMFGGGNAVSIPANAPNANAALVFVDWLTSPEVQSRFNVEFGTAPMNLAADDSAALVSMEMRERQTAWPMRPFRDAVEAHFIDAVILER
ncbi:extracellular solute-binding protein [Salinarimonas ramus]|uniref:LysR family transcriptional regulator n=1 Tax=Salinarimonas ramus TaxID=690164 RepID=A0A917QJC6_9HYPH|nr:extracellular solute-binding protein [Salinarimonas ramus]GGK51715.1 LysR family transcriptional regulator [Salinarimonas ramus]